MSDKLSLSNRRRFRLTTQRQTLKSVGHELSISLFQLRARFAIDNPSHLSLAFVVKLLPFCDPNFEFDLASFQIDAGDDYRHSCCRCRLVKSINFAAVQK